MNIIGQQKYGVKNNPNGLNLFVYNPTRMFFCSIENWGCTILNHFKDSPSKGYIMNPSTVSCEWCHVMHPIVFGDMNNFYNLGMIEKYLSFLYTRKSLSPASFGFIPSMLISFALGQICIFKVVQNAEVWSHVNFFVS